MRRNKLKPPTKEDTVNKNMGSADRKLRAFILAPALVVAGVLTGPAGVLAIVLYALAGVMLATSAVGSCPLYSVLGLRTCPLQKVSTSEGRTVSL
jgi:Protein of unknown function (DUF2892)